MAYKDIFKGTHFKCEVQKITPCHDSGCVESDHELLRYRIFDETIGEYLTQFSSSEEEAWEKLFFIVTSEVSLAGKI